MSSTSGELRVLCGDCREVLAGLEPDSVDAVVTDPPYGLEFMGKEWDTFRISGEVWSDKRTEQPDWNGRVRNRQSTAYPRSKKKRCRLCGRQEFSGTPCQCPNPEWDMIMSQPTQLRAFQQWCEEWAVQVLRVLKPGGHLLAFGGTRTYHRMTCAIEDAGFEVRDCLQWIYGSGFPKSLDVSKAIDAAAQGRNEKHRPIRETIHADKYATPGNGTPKVAYNGYDSLRGSVTAPATPAAQQWQGWGTALKPAYEPIVLARKPLVGTVAQNVQQYGTGAINVDGCRIHTSEKLQQGSARLGYNGANGCATNQHALGRWPANILHDGSEEVVALFPQTTSGALNRGHKQGAGSFGKIGGDIIARNYGNDSGSAARFFYTAKASRSERGEGNTHPTVKPIALMRYLVRLITPQGGLVLDPFVGSGTTLLACKLEGMRGIGIDQDAETVRQLRERYEQARRPLIEDALEVG